MKPLISVVVPMYNESENIRTFYDRLTGALEPTGYLYEIICVNDGSRDNTGQLLNQLRQKDPRVKVIELSRNFGKEAALTAGLDFASGEAVIPIDADLQDPPELIPELIAKWKEGYEVVYATRVRREGESGFKKLTAHLFYRLIRRLTPIDIPTDTGDFRLMARPVVEAMKQLRERHRFMKGLFSWVGFSQASVPYLREPRNAGKTKFNYWKLWNFAIEGITSFSFVPLQISMYAGFVIALIAFIFAVYLVGSKLLFGNPVPGYPSLMVAVLFFGGVQLVTLGILGEYIGRIYNECKGRPLYIVREAAGFADAAAADKSGFKRAV